MACKLGMAIEEACDSAAEALAMCDLLALLCLERGSALGAAWEADD